MELTLGQFEELNALRNSMLRAEFFQAETITNNLAKLESLLFDFFVKLLGYEEANELNDVGESADQLIAAALGGELSVSDELVGD